jgi:quercetin dioxygenase-like cupin family protein/DNA-binding XRE family transcriptional regulator
VSPIVSRDPDQNPSQDGHAAEAEIRELAAKTAGPIDVVVEGIGPKVRQLRRQHNLSLQQLAERSGVSAAAIHKIERSGMVPTVATLMKLAVALKRPVSYFVEEEPARPAVLIRAGARKPVFTSKRGIALEGISGPYGSFFVAGALATVEPGADSGRKPMEHPGEELVYVVEGNLWFRVEEEEFDLGPGDALHFRTDRPHRWANLSRAPARAIWLSLRTS